MVNKYFENFPLISYGNTVCVNITKRATFVNSVMNNDNLYLNYSLDQNERSDILANRQYNDYNMDWLIYFANGIIDPYYQWYLNNSDFINFIQTKYNTDANSLTQKIMFYRNNWYDDIDISVSTFTALPISQQKYYQPVFVGVNTISKYTRRQEDWIKTTNKIVQYTVANTSNFIQDERLTINFDSNNIGYGQLCAKSNTTITIQHTSGIILTSNTTSISNTSYIYGTSSQSNSTFSTSNLLCNNIPIGEDIYWSPISYYDYENERNEKNKNIRLLSSSYAKEASDELISVLK